MAKQFDPKRILRQVSNHLLNDLFMAHGHTLEVRWDDLGETQIDEIFDAWQALPEEDCRAIEIVLHEVSEMANEDGVRAIIEEALRQGHAALIHELDEYESRHDKAVWTHIRAVDVWDLAVRFARADSLSRMRYWITRMDIPAKVPDTSAATKRKLQLALSAFFLATQARGKYCKIEHYVRASGVDYFFCYLDDYADTYINFDETGDYARTPERRAFELVFAYDQQHGTLDMFVRGGKKVYIPLQEIFCRVILSEEIAPENRDSHPYELNGLISRDSHFPTDPNDGIEEVRVRRLRLSVKGMSKRRITLEANPDGDADDIYDMMDEYLNQQRIPASIVNVTQVGFKFSFDQEDPSLPRSLSFDVSYPNSSNLKSKPERLRDLGEKYLKQWGVDRAGIAHAHVESH